MYRLTLTASERKAIDWVGYRYSNGTDLYKLLCGCAWSCDWDDSGDMLIDVPENIAWQISDNAASEDGYWPCFADELADKMQAFIDNIV